MLFEYLLQLATAFGEWVMNQLPDTTGAAQLVIQADSAFSTVLAGGIALSPWIPWAHIVVTIGVVLTLYLLIFAFKVIKQVAAHVPGFGGAG